MSMPDTVEGHLAAGTNAAGGRDNTPEPANATRSTEAVARHFRIEDECAQAQRLKVMAEPDRGG